MKTSLYLKYRPENFENLVGQEHVKTTLINSIKNGKIAHAYIFNGPRGTGKTSSARLLAKAINCTNLKDGYMACNSCEICEAMNDGHLTDLVEIDAASNRRIDDVRELREAIKFMPSRAKYKIYIVDEVHMLTREAFNALLKTLEEPPDHAYFILATTEISKVPNTIISRCQRFDFLRMNDFEIVNRLAKIAKNEGIEVEEGCLETIASRVSGGMRDAIGILDQVSSSGQVTLEILRSTLGMSDNSLVEELLDHWLNANIEAGLRVVSLVHDKGIDFENFEHDLLVSLRKRMLQSLNDKVKLSKTLEIIDAVKKARANHDYAMPQLALEMEMVRVQSVEFRVQSSECRVQSAECRMQSEEIKSQKSEGRSQKLEVKSQKVEVKRQKEEEVKSSEFRVQSEEVKSDVVGVDLEHLSENWKDLLKDVKNPGVRMSLQTGRPAKIEGNVLTIGFDSAFHKGKVDKKENQNMLEEVLKQRLGQTFKVIGEVIAKTENEKKAVADEALEIFGGEIAD